MTKHLTGGPPAKLSLGCCVKARPTIESGAKARKAGVRRRATILWLEVQAIALHVSEKGFGLLCAHF